MRTEHRVIFSDASNMNDLSPESVDLIVTSPPYPMIAMWDEMFRDIDPLIKNALDNNDGPKAFEKMHRILDTVWTQVYRVLKFGGFGCINIGDATRTLNGNFVLYPNHMRILKHLLNLGFTALPCILWRKQTNAPNKYMGSGMLPAGAYVTLEHEYILIVRKGPKREFTKEKDKKRRRESAIFWEERNAWYSDVWFDVKGTLQALNDKDARLRSAAYPYEIAYRLINMYSAKGDTVLDPFLGTGTTTAAAMTLGRNSIGYEIDETLKKIINQMKNVIVETSTQVIQKRLTQHIDFVINWKKTKGDFKYENINYGFPVMTAQEREILYNDPIVAKSSSKDTYEIEYSMEPQKDFCKNWSLELNSDKIDKLSEKLLSQARTKVSKQLELF